MDSKERIDQLTDQLKEAGYRYYVLDDPTMEDYEYDRLYRELEELEKKEEKKSKKASALSLTSVVPKNKASSLYKIVKQLESDSKKSKKDILKDLVVSQNSDGTITLNFK